MFFFFLATLFIALLLEGAVTTLPLVLIVLLCLTIYRRDGIVFPIAFAAGLILDIMTIRVLGASSIFFSLILFMILLYQRKYEINSYPFVTVSSFFGALGYLLVFGYANWFMQSVLSSIVAVLLFMPLRFFNKDLTSQNSKLKYTT